MLCDKCGKEVPLSNDVAVIESLGLDSPLVVLAYPARHFLPTADCQGSPSRAQYIEGQPRDSRGFVYDARVEPYWRKGYALAQLVQE